MKVREKRQEVEDLLDQAQVLFDAIQSKKAWAEHVAKQLSAKRQDWLRSQFAYGGGTHAAVDMPPGGRARSSTVRSSSPARTATASVPRGTPAGTTFTPE